MRQWLRSYGKYLTIVIERSSLPPQTKCSICQTSLAMYRCLECVGPTLTCLHCCYNGHTNLPLHRIEEWTGSHFEPSWLWRVGTTVYLGHNGSPCPTSSSPDKDIPSPAPTPLKDDITYGSKPPGRKLRGHPVLVVVHTNGIHHLPFVPCSCASSESFHLQLLRAGFYPSTEDDVRSTFTCQLLDYYLTETLECHTSTHHFFTKLRRLTNPTFPQSTVDRYRELMRVGRQWRFLQELAMFGFANSHKYPGEGELALFCAACPQPGINLPKNWQDDLRKWLYTRGFVIDGNFVCIHRMLREGTLDMWLKSGEGYTTAPTPYKKHIDSTVEKKEASKCYDHRAIADRHKAHKGCDASGIGALACSRHGAFVPTTIVDFQKGERQMNIDYALSKGLSYGPTLEAPSILVLYDIACQFLINAPKRMDSGEHLELTSEDLKKVVWGIGTWHVHGHKEECLPRFSPSFIPGAGMTSGEILESLWSVLNEVGLTTSVMTLPHRAEVLDANMLDNNWKKMLGLIPTLSKNLITSRKEQAEAQGDFDSLSSTALPQQIQDWSAQIADAEEGRREDVKAMDIFNVTLFKPPTLKDVQADLIETENRTDTLNTVGATKWITLGIDIQDRQLQLILLLRRYGKAQTRAQIAEIKSRRERLSAQIHDFFRLGDSLFPQLNLSDIDIVSPPLPFCMCDEEECSHKGESSNPLFVEDGLPEYIKIPLPSLVTHIPSCWTQLTSSELKLRLAQCHDCISRIRLEVGNKSFIFKSNIRLATGKKDRLRGYAAVASSNRVVNYQRAIYTQARWCLPRLGCSSGNLLKLKEISPNDVKAIPVVYNPQARNQRNKPLPWIWALDVAGDAANAAHLAELHRVNWIRAKCRLTRWIEEHTLISEEMGWVLNYFNHEAAKWEAWATDPSQTDAEKAWADRRSAMWMRLRLYAEGRFHEARRKLAEYLETIKADPVGDIEDEI
ncbi:hypothetical protein DFP72DRAFT_986402 [Ephemerocybe angulata]|uniref:CxC2-like cysteine cluster KDZ transposase-associated domain-containing protein n=1 Tax=Ephemerocybe angulata TaxID=980116 RepID=A0A8H6MFN9_9AGAR|nr:hypothetical protein DFP72DRAFT_986402 [Tulosesus angulatus]